MLVARGCLTAVTQRMVEPVPKSPAAHRCRAMVEQLEHGPVFAAQRLGDLKVAACDRSSVMKSEVDSRFSDVMCVSRLP